MSELEEAFGNFAEEIRLLLDRDPMKGLERWSALLTELAERGHFELCDSLFEMVKGMDLPPHGLGIVRYGEGWMYDRSGRWQEAIFAYESALAVFDDVKIPLKALILTQMGSLYQDQGDFERAATTYGKALEAATDDHGRALVLNDLGGLASLQEDAVQARRHFEAAKEILSATDDKYNYAASCAGLGSVLRDEGRLQDSVDQLVEAIIVFRDISSAKGLSTSIASLGLTYYRAARLEESAQTYQTALKYFVDLNDRSNTAKTLSNLALTSVASGDREQAIFYLEEAIAEYAEIGDAHGEALAKDNLRRVFDGETG